MDSRRITVKFGILAIAVAALMLCVTPTSRALTEALPPRLDDRTFWTLVTEFSEPNGFFRSDNLVSNEMVFQRVIPTLQQTVLPASAYVGVGPDQNFTYIAALKPRIAFIVDIRRQNMLLHLMYKALIEMSPTREAFMSRLFSRPVPAGTTPDDSVGGAARRVREGGARWGRLRAQSLGDLRAPPGHARLQPEPRRPGGHRLRLSRLLQRRSRHPVFVRARLRLAAVSDLPGPDDRRRRGGRAAGLPGERGDLPDAARSRDAQSDRPAGRRLRRAEGASLGRALPRPAPRDGERVLHLERRAVPLPRRRLAAVLQQRRRAADRRPQHVRPRLLQQPGACGVRPAAVRAARSAVGRRPDPAGIRTASGPGPRSETLLNPISRLLAAFNDGRVSNYYDVIELSR